MDIESDLKLPMNTDTENIMDDINLSKVKFMSKFEKF